MASDLDRLAELNGIGLSYVTETGEERWPSDRAKRDLLAALGIPAATDDDVAQSLSELEHPRCYIPAWLQEERAWGITCQLYSLRSDRNWGMGDFEDLARLAELAAGTGADFVGVNPLHALFLAEPRRFSPYAPSSRRFLNPLCIAVDDFETHPTPPERLIDAARNAELIDYPAVAEIKRQAFEAEYADFLIRHGGTGSERGAAFEAFRREHGALLEDFALFEALSEAFVRQSLPCGWHCWPEAFRDKNGEAVRTFREQNHDRIRFHIWLQWLAHEQLAAAQRRATAAGMRIGLYLDLAVGVAQDGAETWSQPDVVLRGVRIGAPPDGFNPHGQDWGLAPISPRVLTADVQAFSNIIADAMQSAGAVRIDHVMALRRLYLISDGLGSADGAYVSYPLERMIGGLAHVSHRNRAVVIGEDLGTVPPNFRETMRDAGLLGYRVLFFEREGDGRFRPPRNYERDAMACISTHDLPTLRGWWGGHDLDDRETIGMDDPAASPHRAQREADRRLLLIALEQEGLLPPELAEAARGEQPLPQELSQELATAISRFLARTPCRLVAVQLEDLAFMRDRANLPGTMDEHPNWRRKLPLSLDELARAPAFQAITQAMAEERPRSHD